MRARHAWRAVAVARAIVRAHGGNTWVDRPPAGGTQFRFTLPLDAASATTTALAIAAGKI